MDNLIAGMKYYCSDESLEKAESYKNSKSGCSPYTWTGNCFVTGTNRPIRWRYWVRADGETPQQAVTFPYTPGKKYLFKNEGSIGSAVRVYVCTIGGKHYSVLSGYDSEYPNGQFETFAWDKVVETDNVTEMTMEQVSSVLREKGVITGTLKIKE